MCIEYVYILININFLPSAGRSDYTREKDEFSSFITAHTYFGR